MLHLTLHEGPPADAAVQLRSHLASQRPTLG
jgi:hypothetical protein